MNICILCRFVTQDTIVSGGMETYIQDLINGFVSRGDLVTVIASKSPTGVITAHNFKLIETSRCITANPLTRIRYFIESRSLFMKLHKQQSFDVISSQSNFAFGVSRYCQKKRIPIIVTAHGTTINEFRSIQQSRPDLVIFWLPLLLLYYLIERILYNRAQKIITVSKELKTDIFVQLKTTKSKIVIIENGVDTELFSPHGKRSTQIKLLTASQLNQQKGIHLAIQAVAGLLNVGYKISLDIVGDGPSKTDLRKLVNKLHIDNNVNFLGKISHDKMPKIYPQYSIFLLPTLRREGLPYAALEAMSTGMPIISTSLGGLRSLVKHHKTGLVVQAKNVNDLKSAIAELIDDAKLRRLLGRAGRELIQHHYSRSIMLSKTIELYINTVQVRTSHE